MILKLRLNPPETYRTGTRYLVPHIRIAWNSAGCQQRETFSEVLSTLMKFIDLWQRHEGDLLEIGYVSPFPRSR